MFKPVTRSQNRLRLALDGPAGSGKTYTALRLAFAMAGEQGRVAVIDTEHGSAAKYEGESPDGRPWKWDGVVLEHFAPSTYEATIKEAGRLGYDVLVIDSLSHAWAGVGGALDQVDRAKTTNSFTAWKDVTPQHNAMVEAILQSPCHIIATLRSTMEYILEEDEKGKKVPKKIGMAPVQRKGVEYEFDLIGDLDLSHTMVVSKSRCPTVDGKVVSRPDAAFIGPVKAWLFSGVPRIDPPPTAAMAPAPAPATTSLASATVRVAAKPAEKANRQQIDRIILIWGEHLKRTPEALKDAIRKRGFEKIADMPRNDAEDLLRALEAKSLQEQGKEAF